MAELEGTLVASMDHAPGGQAIRGPEWWQGKRGVKAGAKGRDAGAAGAQSEKLPLHNNTQQWLRRRAPTGHRRRSALKGRKPQSQGALRPGLECGGAVAVLVLTACAKEDLADSAQQQKDKNRRDRREHRGGKRYIVSFFGADIFFLAATDGLLRRANQRPLLDDPPRTTGANTSYAERRKRRTRINPLPARHDAFPSRTCATPFAQIQSHADRAVLASAATLLLCGLQTPLTSCVQTALTSCVRREWLSCLTVFPHCRCRAPFWSSRLVGESSVAQRDSHHIRYTETPLHDHGSGTPCDGCPGGWRV